MLASEEVAPASRSRWLPLVLPLALLVALGAVLLLADPGAWIDNGAPAAEEIAFERVVLNDEGFVLHVRNAVGAPVTIAQVMVDDAFWDFTAEPDAVLERFGSATLTVPYPWVAGEPHSIGIVTNTGLVWTYDVAVAMETPTPAPASLGTYALIGILVGVVPVAIGMAFYPAMRDAPARWTNALLAFTLGLLAFLAVDTIGEGLELAGEMPGSYHGLALFFGSALLALLGVLALERALRGRAAAARREDRAVGASDAGPAVLAILIAIGIGLHNMGEGLLIGSAFALGSLALGTALIVGFAVHNVTEGPAIVAPLARGAGLPWARFLLLAAIAGAPTILGAWLGAFASYSILPVLFFGLGAGAILVVLVQVGLAMRQDGALFTPLHATAFVVGYAVMMATGFLTA